MKSGSQETSQSMQRVRVGVTGLAMVMVLIALASAIFSSANREEPLRRSAPRTPPQSPT